MSEEETCPPYSTEQQAYLNEWQFSASIHPFTCARDHGRFVGLRLVALIDGWHCPSQSCDYTQDWAFGFMISGPPSPWTVSK